MEITTHAFWTSVHGMLFGALFLLGCSGAVIGLYQWMDRSTASEPKPGQERFLRIYLITMVVIAWAAVLSGAYVVYPWYRALPPPGTVDLSLFPQRLLLSKASTAGWHSLGMEWKEHIAWSTAILITMIAFVFIRYGRNLREHQPLRTAVLVFAVASFVTASIAGFFGAMINKYAPIQGGESVAVMHEAAK